jgi:hypothetical protein
MWRRFSPPDADSTAKRRSSWVASKGDRSWAHGRTPGRARSSHPRIFPDSAVRQGDFPETENPHVTQVNAVSYEIAVDSARTRGVSAPVVEEAVVESVRRFVLAPKSGRESRPGGAPAADGGIEPATGGVEDGQCSGVGVYRLPFRRRRCFTHGTDSSSANSLQHAF